MAQSVSFLVRSALCSMLHAFLLIAQRFNPEKWDFVFDYYSYRKDSTGFANAARID
jgi:hypothetical protein